MIIQYLAGKGAYAPTVIEGRIVDAANSHELAWFGKSMYEIYNLCDGVVVRVDGDSQLHQVLRDLNRARRGLIPVNNEGVTIIGPVYSERLSDEDRSALQPSTGRTIAA